MRKLADVIDRLLEEIPESQVRLIRCLANIQDSATYTPPEQMSFRWRQCQEVLFEELGYDKVEEDGWLKNVQEIWMGIK